MNFINPEGLARVDKVSDTIILGSRHFLPLSLMVDLVHSLSPDRIKRAANQARTIRPRTISSAYLAYQLTTGPTIQIHDRQSLLYRNRNLLRYSSFGAVISGTSHSYPTSPACWAQGEQSQLALWR